MNFKKVLVLSPHTDDAELCAGGTIAKLVENRCEVACFAFSLVRKELKAEFEKAMNVLGVKNQTIYDFPVRHFPEHRQDILEILYNYDKENKPDLVLTPSTTDLHQDHQVITSEVMRAFKRSTILGYFAYWDNIVVTENCFIQLEKRHVQKKIEALHNYKSQMNRKYFNDDYLKGLLTVSGLQINEKYAEAFEVIKLVLYGLG